MKNILVLSFFPAFVPARSGGEVRLYNFYFALSEFYNIKLISSGHVGARNERLWHSNRFEEIRVGKGTAFLNEWADLDGHAGGGDLSAPCVLAEGATYSEFSKCYFANHEWADCIIHDSPFTISCDIFARMDGKPRVYNSYNCETTLYSTLHQSNKSSRIPEIVRVAEIRTLKMCDMIAYCSENDLRDFKGILNEDISNPVYVPNGMSAVSHVKRESHDSLRSVLFVGSAHLPNIEAAQFILKEIAPKLPEITFNFAGECLPEGAYPSNIVRHGIVSAIEKAELISRADLAINPMLSGGGSSLKILDFAAHALPILSTPHGIRGFDFRHDLEVRIALPEDFVEALRGLIKNPQVLPHLGVAAQARANEKYTWTGIAKDFKVHLDSLSRIAFRPNRYILAINDFNPFDSVGGGATRLRGIYQALEEQHDIVVLCFGSTLKVEISIISPKITCISIPKNEAHINEENIFNGLSHISANDILAYQFAPQNDYLVDAYRVLRRQASVIICEHPYMVAIPSGFQDSYIYSSQNHELLLKRDLLEWHPERSRLVNAVEHAENIAISGASAVVVVSEQDGASMLFGRDYGPAVYLVPNGASVPLDPSTEDLRTAERSINDKSIIFLGSAHMPNVDAAKFIVENLAPKLPQFNFNIIGSVCDALPKNLPPNLKLWGVVSDGLKSALMRSAAIGINPMFGGSGSNVKLADFLANGLFVVSTSFGIRGYPDEVLPHILKATPESFASDIIAAVTNVENRTREAMEQRRSLFDQKLSMKAIGSRFLEIVSNSVNRRTRVLFVTYRYCWPMRGGAESMLYRLIKGLGASQEFSIDVVSPKITAIHETGRFAANYSYEESGAPAMNGNVRYLRLPIDAESQPELILPKLRMAWRAQNIFEKSLFMMRRSEISHDGLAWGWGGPEGDMALVGRWAMSDCGLFTKSAALVEISAYSSVKIPIRVVGEGGIDILHELFEGHFKISFASKGGVISISSSVDSNLFEHDSRPLAFYVNAVKIDENNLDLRDPPLGSADSLRSDEIYNQLLDASELSRNAMDVNLTDIRGPHSSEFELFLEKCVNQYDLVVTHNGVFKTSALAIAHASKAGVPSILIPHAHLDDDFYHFPDVHGMAKSASVVLASPRNACDFYRKLGLENVSYLPAGIDTSGVASEADTSAFQKAYGRKERYFLVLGRKAAAKGYACIVRAMNEMATKYSVRLVMIGPDDDGLQVTSSHTDYLGQQPIEVVRGALKNCCALINMSTSESFGIVLLEAWLNGRPVIVNSDCAAFHDMAIDHKNSLMVTQDSLLPAMIKLYLDEPLCNDLAVAGRRVVDDYEWSSIIDRFAEVCRLTSKTIASIS